MLIQNAELWQGGVADLRIEDGAILNIGALSATGQENVIDASGGVLLPGLHDHHIHLAALAARQYSVCCGPPKVETALALAQSLNLPGDGWIRGIDYHESVAGMLDTSTLDEIQPNRPVRIQHRSGRMWFLNSLALDLLLQGATPPPGLERSGTRYTGRLFNEDRWLRGTLRSALPELATVSANLARVGVTGITDMTPSNSPEIAAHFLAQQRSGALVQNVLLAGSLSLINAPFSDRLVMGPAKLHLHDAQLPDLDDAILFIRSAHMQNRAVAIHCVTEVELVFALSILEAAGVKTGDRIEHASIAPDHLVERVKNLALWIITQPHFITERGDQYLSTVGEMDHPNLYRLRAFVDAGVPLAGGTDAPFGGIDPWTAMRAATSRRTASGRIIGGAEALTPEEAISLFLADPRDLARQPTIKLGRPADLVLLKKSWAEARLRLTAADVRITIINGSIVYDGVNETPFERRHGVDPLAGEYHQCCAMTANPA